jgi:hypothetical protein
MQSGGPPAFKRVKPKPKFREFLHVKDAYEWLYPGETMSKEYRKWSRENRKNWKNCTPPPEFADMHAKYFKIIWTSQIWHKSTRAFLCRILPKTLF